MGEQANWKPRFFTIWTGQAFSLFGSSLANFALIWWLTATTGSATVLAVGTLITLLPGIFIGPFAGALVDRWDRRAIMLVADTTGAVAAASLALLFWTGAIEVWHVYVVMFVRSLAGAFHFPSMQASTSLLVPDDQLTRIAGLNQMLQGASGIAAPPLGALLIALLPLPALMAIDVVTALIAVGTMAVIHIPRPPRAAADAGAPASVLRETLAGLRYIWEWPGLRAVLILATVLNLLLTPAFSLLPILVTRHFGGGAFHLAGMEAASGIGIIGGGLLLGIWGGFKRRILTSALGLGGLGVGTLLIGLAPAWLFPMGLIGMLIVGIMSPITNGPFFAIVQSVVRPDMQGRVFTVLGAVSSGLAPLGLAVAGPLSDVVGVQMWYITGGVASIALLFVCIATPAIMRLEERAAGAGEAGAGAAIDARGVEAQG